MKPSEAMLSGLAMVKGEQCFGPRYMGPSHNPCAVCARGAIQLAICGDFDVSGKAWDEYMVLMNLADAKWESLFDNGIAVDADAGMAIEDIAGILAAEGL